MKTINKNWITLIAMITMALNGFAQPSNDNCGGAIPLVAGSTCVPTQGTTAGATQSQPGCTGTADDDVWYSFVANAPALSIVVTGTPQFNPVLQVFSGSCGGSSLGCADNTFNGGTETVTLTTLFPGVTYWVRVYHSPATISSNPVFSICVTAPILQPICNPNSLVPSNVPCVMVPKVCELNGFCGETINFPNPASPSGFSPYTPNVWPQLTAAFCGSIENNSFMQFEASAVTVQLRIYGGCVSGNGIQLMVFSYNNPTDCGVGAITSYGCFNNVDLTPSPASGVPVSFTGMVPGTTYYVMIDGNAGAQCNYIIGADFGVAVSVSATPAVSTICLGNSVLLTASGGNGIFNWDANPDLSATVGATTTATPTALGQQVYFVNSPSGSPDCPGTYDSSIVNVTTIPTPDAGIDDSVCFDPAGTVINLNGILSDSTNARLWQFLPPPGPAPTVTFTPNFSSLTAAVTVNQPGLYRFILRETSLICGAYRDTVNVLVIDPQQTTTSAAPSCVGNNDGTITINNAQANEFSFDNGATWVTTNTSSVFASGTYDVCSRTPNGCVVCTSVTVAVPPAVLISVSNDTIVCENGTATLIAQGFGGTSFTYNWTGFAGNTSNIQQIISPTVGAYYVVQAINQGGCLSPIDSIFVDVNPALDGTISPDLAICPGDFATLNATASGGNSGPYVFSWSNGSVGNGVANSTSVSPAITTNYTLTITDGCESTPFVQDVTVTVSPVPNPSFTVLEDSICEDAVFRLYNTTDPLTVQTAFWSISDGQTYSNRDSITTGEMSKGVYSVTLTITSNDGCVNNITVPAALASMARPTTNFRSTPATVTAFNTEVRMENQSLDATFYYWSFESGNPPTSIVENPITTFPEGTTGNYRVQLVTESSFGCLDTMFQIVEVRPEVILYAPNTFTPDDDEFNATWKIFIEGIDPSVFEMQVFDRWGSMIFQSFDPSAEWDGSFNGRILPTGMYSWKIRAKDASNGENYIWTGNVLILK